MQVLVGRMSDEGRFAEEPPVPGAKLIDWTEARSGGIRMASTPGEKAKRQPDKVATCRAWAIEVESIEEFLKTLDYWRTDHAASVQVRVRDRGRFGRANGEQNIVVVLEDHEYEGFINPCVVDVVSVDKKPA